MQSKHCDEPCNTALIEKNGIAPFCSDCYLLPPASKGWRKVSKEGWRKVLSGRVSQSQLGGPHSWLGIHQSQPGGTPVLTRGYPMTRVTPARKELGYSSPLPGQDWNTPLGRTGVTPPPPSEYLLRGGRYGSCGFSQQDFLVSVDFNESRATSVFAALTMTLAVNGA